MMFRCQMETFPRLLRRSLRANIHAGNLMRKNVQHVQRKRGGSLKRKTFLASSWQDPPGRARRGERLPSAYLLARWLREVNHPARIRPLPSPIETKEATERIFLPRGRRHLTSRRGLGTHAPPKQRKPASHWLESASAGQGRRPSF